MPDIPGELADDRHHPVPHARSGSRSVRSETGRQTGLSTRLLGSVGKKSYDPVADIGWAAPIPEGLYGLSPEWTTLYGTALWDSLSEDQRITLTSTSTARSPASASDASAPLMHLVLRDIHGPSERTRPQPWASWVA